jgi:hypothetical protein
LVLEMQLLCPSSDYKSCQFDAESNEVVKLPEDPMAIIELVIVRPPDDWGNGHVVSGGERGADAHGLVGLEVLRRRGRA